MAGSAWAVPRAWGQNSRLVVVRVGGCKAVDRPSRPTLSLALPSYHLTLPPPPFSVQTCKKAGGRRAAAQEVGGPHGQLL